MKNINHPQPWLGCIADDYTGATDLASFLVASGLRTVQLNGLPDDSLTFDLSTYDAVVIALKSRTCSADLAVEQSLKSLAFLQQVGCQKYYFKYCSTFDSTVDGNIGPVIDGLMAELDVDSTVVCPALPVNGRTVYNGYLFVNGVPLHESSMKDHPLTPMTDSSIQRMLEAQGSGTAALVDINAVVKGEEYLKSALAEAAQDAKYVVVDALSTQHLTCISHCLSDFSLITGGSGLATDLAAEFVQAGGTLQLSEETQGIQSEHAVIFSGSCSSMTQKQVAEYAKYHPSLQLNPLNIANGKQSVQSIFDWMNTNINASPLIYASADAQTVQLVHQTLGKAQAAELVEQTFCQLAIEAKQKGVRNFIVAGGETSGAVVNALGVRVFEIGPSIEPSVPVVTTLDDEPINLALKSGNFGQQDFFSKAKRKLTCS